MPRKKRLKENVIAHKLISSYPDSIVVDEEYNLDFEGTVYNFAVHVMEDMTAEQQDPIFGKVFDTVDELYDHLILHVPSLREELYAFMEI